MYSRLTGMTVRFKKNHYNLKHLEDRDGIIQSIYLVNGQPRYTISVSNSELQSLNHLVEASADDFVLVD